MVCVNFRLKTQWDRSQIIDFFEELGYDYRRTNKKSIKIGTDFVHTEEFLRYSKNRKGRNHIFVKIGRKYSGKSHHPQMKVYAHYDLIKFVKGKEKHFTDKNEGRNIKEIDRIEKQLKLKELGYLEHKDKNCAHGTIELTYSDRLNGILAQDYVNYDIGKYRRKLNSHQFTLTIIYQYKYIHIICVYAIITKDNHHILKKVKAERELERIKKKLKDK